MPSQLLKHMVDTMGSPTAPLYENIEQRNLLRVELPFPAIVRGVDATNQVFEEQTLLDNLSANSLSLTLGRCIEPGAELFLVIRLSTEPADLAPAPRVALRGVAQRIVSQSSTTYTVAIMFTRYRFLYAKVE